MTADGDDWEPPATFDEYRVVRRLGGGAMGEVYLAEDVLLERQVAVKFVRARASDERFYTEARAIARLAHPNVVAVHRVGRARKRPYLVSEYVAGQSLDQLALPLPPARVVEIGVALASGLAAAHRAGVLHRDVKPANAIVAASGEVKLLDFGLAKLVGGDDAFAHAPTATTAAPPSPRTDETLDSGHATAGAAGEAEGGVARTRPGTLLGSPLYMAPEAWRGEPATVASDLYSLGVLLYELAAGRPPRHELPMAALRVDVEEREPPPLASVAPSVPAPLAAAIDRCLRRDPAARFASAEALRDALDRGADAPAPLAEPYRGLHPFAAEHRALFHGRGAETRAVAERLRGEPFVLVAGDSGVGKSSLCAAGVVPRVLERGLGSARTWSAVTLAPGRRPLAALAAALASEAGTDEAALASALRDDPAEAARALRRRLGGERGVVVYVDQLEELVTVSVPDEATATALALAELALRAPSLRVLATARSDFLTRLTALPRLGAEIAPALYLLAPMTDDGVREAIVGPARAAGCELESEALIAELAAAAPGDGLPLLQFALATLWERRDRARNVITAASLAAIGGVGGALAGHADRVVDALAPGPREAARRIALRLVTAEGTRVARAADELDATADGAIALEALVRGRLVVARAGAYELAHEVLIAAWGTLARWMSGDLERRAARERLERAARDWERAGRPADALWSPRLLAELGGEVEALTGRDAAFAIASTRAARRRVVVRRAVAVGALAAAIAGYAGLRWQDRRAVAARVATHTRSAEDALAEAEAHDAARRTLRDRAFAAFDAVPLVDPIAAQAEALWAEHGERVAAIQALHARAELALEHALLVDGSRGDVRRRFAELLFARAALADDLHQRDRRDDFLARLAIHDRDGALRRRWDAPAAVAITTTPPAAVTVARHADDATRAPGAPEARGTTPVELTLAPGSYLVTLTAPDRPPVRCPLVVERGGRHAVDVAIPVRVPDGFVFVPAGRFLYGAAGSDQLRVGFFYTQPIHPAATGSFLIARHEITFADWIEFLAALPPDEREARRPLAGNELGAIELADDGGTWRLTFQPEGPRGPKLTARAGEPIVYPGRTRRMAVDWRTLPVTGVSWDDFHAYAAWLDRDGRVPGARLCDEREWERAARGADDREFPHADRVDADDANIDVTYDRVSGGYGLDPAGSHPASDSPFGVADLTGNAGELVASMRWRTPTLGDLRDPARWVHSGREVGLRGGTFYRDAVSAQIVNRAFATPTYRDAQIGARLCADLPAAFHAKED